jgi:hypothetical protein
MRMTREFSRGLTVAMLAAQLPFSLIALLRFVCARDATRHGMAAQRVTVRAQIALTIETLETPLAPQPRSVSIGRDASRAHSPIEAS